MQIVVIGSGIAGITFAEAFNKLRPDCRVTVLTQEGLGYYSRPMLSHGFSREDVETKIILRSFESLRETGLEIHSETEVSGLDRATKTVRVRRGGEEFSQAYDKLVLASGSAALVPGPFRASALPHWVVNSLSDLIGLRRFRAQLVDSSASPRWAIIGGGLIGSEVASDLAKAGDRVMLFHALPRLMERQLLEEDSATLLQVFQKQGIEIRLNAAVQGFSEVDGLAAVHLASGRESGFHGIIVACGFKPRTELASEAGLPVNRGVLVDDFLRTTDPAIHAIGDVAECTDGRLYAYVLPIRQQALWLAQFLAGTLSNAWQPPVFQPRAKVHGFQPAYPLQF